MKKFSTLLFAVMFLFSVFPGNSFVYAAEEEKISGYSERVVIEQETYTLSYYYEGEDQYIEIYNEATEQSDILVYDRQTGYFYLNGNIVAEVIHYQHTYSSVERQPALRSWVYEGYYSDYITYAQGISVTVLAAIIGAVVGGASAGAVIARAGATVLAAVAASSIGMTINYYLYSQDLIDGMSLWYQWQFIPSSGGVYGWYDIYFTYSYYE